MQRTYSTQVGTCSAKNDALTIVNGGVNNFSDTCKIPPVLWRDELAHGACDVITGAADRP